MKTIQEQIEVMQHFANGGEIQCCANCGIDYEDFEKGVSPSWNWQSYDYRIKEQKKTITIEKWLVEIDKNQYKTVEGTINYIDSIYPNDKVKLLETCEVEL